MDCFEHVSAPMHIKKEVREPLFITGSIKTVFPKLRSLITIDLSEGMTGNELEDDHRIY